MNNTEIHQTKSTPRQSNLELYRIIVMLFIVAHHYVVNSGVMKLMQEDPTSFRSIYYYVFGAWGKVGINCFVLITGYFMCTSTITLQKFLKLFLEVIFYMITVNIIMIAIGVGHFSVREIWSDLQLLFDVSSCFTSCFIMFYLFIPFLNILVRNMTQQQHLYLVVLCLTIYTGISTFMLGKVEMNYIVWFSILYFIASYIRLYQPMQNVRWGLIFFGGGIVSIATIVIPLCLGEMLGKTLPYYHFLSDSNKLLAVVLSVSMFMYFKDMQIPHSKLINRIAQSCFGVLLIHANSNAMRQWLWTDTLDVAGYYYTEFYVLHSVLSVIGIYIVCTVIDQLRIELLEKPLFSRLGKFEFTNGRLIKK